MNEVVSVRDLRNAGGEVLRRVERGERIIVTRDGDPVAMLNPLPRRAASAAELIRRRRHLPHVDPDALRSDIDSVLDSSL
ncbi:hypothetical protein GOARA_064_00160 [Gordonia araii NBRC 100433]|uniref:Uncharacterized protein n=1 Tax=Gordonia araii NBRC 100433 TaxID=1073574 RepID=G7H589_9ACTN|nr:type II toxin-antitoxin system prevent-host-death family antitoxin [Gordonia araii]NNG95729.1 type II toxin-antitoxin system prevent-host-death family antitoxin [Gordonia araii NBRC 100433]GAB11014.1 hypothetical protein GOARA_064_00160 [Gordonia araii NBRC 100433]